MRPGVKYTADDGSTVELQILIQEAAIPPADLPFVFRQPDRMRDVRLFMTAPDGRSAAFHLHSPTQVADTLMTMYGDIQPALHAKAGIVTDPREWSGPMRGEW